MKRIIRNHINCITLWIHEWMQLQLPLLQDRLVQCQGQCRICKAGSESHVKKMCISKTSRLWEKRDSRYSSLLNLMYMAKSWAMHLHHPTKLWVSNSNWKRMVSKMFKVCQSMTKKNWCSCHSPTSSCLHQADRSQRSGNLMREISIKLESWMPTYLRSVLSRGCLPSAGPSRTKRSKLFTDFQILTATSSLRAGTPLKSSCLSTSNEPRSVKTSSKTSIQTPLLLTQTV